MNIHRFLLPSILILGFLFVSLSFIITDSSFFLDSSINAWAQGITNPFGIQFFDFIAWLGDTIGIMFISFFTLIFLYRKQLYLKTYILLGSMLLTVGSSIFVKFLVERARPSNRIFEYHGYSFPSGHTTMSILFYGLLLYFVLHEVSSKIAQGLIIFFSVSLSLLVIFSRIYLSVHWFSDIIGGLLLGTFFLLSGILVYTKMSTKKYYKKK